MKNEMVNVVPAEAGLRMLVWDRIGKRVGEGDLMECACVRVVAWQVTTRFDFEEGGWVSSTNPVFDDNEVQGEYGFDEHHTTDECLAFKCPHAERRNDQRTARLRLEARERLWPGRYRRGPASG